MVPGGERSISTDVRFDRGLAEFCAKTLVSKLDAYCHRVKVCGGLRRGNDTVHDIDIVAWPHDFFMISAIIGGLGGRSTKDKFILKTKDLPPIEIWIAYDEIQYEVLKLVRTGSAGFNLELASGAHMNNMTLKYSKGLYGLYAAYPSYSAKERRTIMVLNPLRRLHWREEDMISAVFGTESEYLVPQNRNVQFQYHRNVEDEMMGEEF